MRAFGHRQNLPLTAPEALLELDLPRPEPQGRDLLVEIRAVSVNPVDVKLRGGRPAPEGQARVLGYDAAGVVVATGPEATLFRPGDAVFYAGDINRPGSNAEFQLVDERIVGPKPASLDFAAAAALPLTTLTAWEMLFDRFGLAEGGGEGQHLLLVGAAGGVGSIALQLARQRTKLTITATASRPETVEWVKAQGAHAVVDHRQPLDQALREAGLPQPELIFAINGTEGHFPALAAALAPQGRIGVIDDPKSLDIGLLKTKSASFHWEFMFTRAAYATPDMQRQHAILAEAARLVDAGTLRSTLSEVLGPIDLPTLREAHRRLESGTARGKLVLQGFA
ncbi:zinc-binding alcohol dehydrogenase family protein [Pseudoroseomonas cervicalis]|uniref:zinc-binding alcohol dehydrogenase family protein n=1 Tax=Teichococcus cervicalis TaxID=204525 RepID=UPI0022F16C30|nr:zinc-binding alcohol dehydrogenase family protein [Pseudoroseomonas cervicalis]WBV43780.1 zinc-binding alcohol dehydrogenase family protein [Pseudoroseomonas cervicalis]